MDIRGRINLYLKVKSYYTEIFTGMVKDDTRKESSTNPKLIAVHDNSKELENQKEILLYFIGNAIFNLHLELEDIITRIFFIDTIFHLFTESKEGNFVEPIYSLIEHIKVKLIEKGVYQPISDKSKDLVDLSEKYISSISEDSFGSTNKISSHLTKIIMGQPYVSSIIVAYNVLMELLFRNNTIQFDYTFIPESTPEKKIDLLMMFEAFATEEQYDKRDTLFKVAKKLGEAKFSYIAPFLEYSPECTEFLNGYFDVSDVTYLKIQERLLITVMKEKELEIYLLPLMDVIRYDNIDVYTEDLNNMKLKLFLMALVVNEGNKEFSTLTSTEFFISSLFKSK